MRFVPGLNKKEVLTLKHYVLKTKGDAKKEHKVKKLFKIRWIFTSSNVHWLSHRILRYSRSVGLKKNSNKYMKWNFYPNYVKKHKDTSKFM